VAIAFEYHGLASAPDDCFGKTISLLFTLNSLWISDADLGAAFHQWNGMPVTVADIERTPPAQASGPERWTFTAGGVSSWFEVPVVDSPLVPVSDPRGYAWGNGTETAIFVLDNDYMKHNYNVIATEGAMNPPTLWSQIGHGLPFAGRGDVYESAVLKPSLVAYKDADCKIPE
jgi:hypothetical protein